MVCEWVVLSCVAALGDLWVVVLADAFDGLLDVLLVDVLVMILSGKARWWLVADAILV